ncbi:GNAT family N-acetyltransferase [Alkaliphilus sp. B6464]|uniref:GNAT family N-acetyltransferase n=1 Tax=Alkaliphilus sp. B6464 TaxID=2731219 RepID=UPI001BA91FB6|nr:GNAT family N-acetyltransferase [Alkaliphilus sp. B6464]QUH19318.1 GNAT family N-acetyltransferase [Alkaliphilus sp. B6464]
MMQELIRFAKEYGTIRNISLGVKASNKNAIILYEKFGFQKIGLHKNYFNVNGSFDDEILMDLYI